MSLYPIRSKILLVFSVALIAIATTNFSLAEAQTAQSRSGVRFSAEIGRILRSLQRLLEGSYNGAAGVCRTTCPNINEFVEQFRPQITRLCTENVNQYAEGRPIARRLCISGWMRGVANRLENVCRVCESIRIQPVRTPIPPSASPIPTPYVEDIALK
jgi:hypothetical protein